MVCLSVQNRGSIPGSDYLGHNKDQKERINMADNIAGETEVPKKDKGGRVWLQAAMAVGAAVLVLGLVLALSFALGDQREGTGSGGSQGPQRGGISWGMEPLLSALAGMNESGKDSPDEAGHQEGTESEGNGPGESGTGPSEGSNGGGGEDSQPKDPTDKRVWHEPWDEQVLVSAAWTEEIYHPAVYTTVHHPEQGHVGSICNTCGIEVTGYGNQHLLDTGHSSFTSYHWFVDSPEWDEQVLTSAAWTEYISHPAVYRTVHHDGWWE